MTQTTTEVRSYDYDPDTGLLQYVTLTRPDESASAIRRVALTTMELAIAVVTTAT